MDVAGLEWGQAHSKYRAPLGLYCSLKDLGPLIPDEVTNSGVRVMGEGKAFLATSQQAENKGLSQELQLARSHRHSCLDGVPRGLILGIAR